jgi:hypothetical protein
VIGLDDTIERRWGAKISARGIYRDPVRSSKGHFVKASSLRWLSAMLLVKVPWADRVMALPFLTLLGPSKRFYADKTRAPKTLIDWARQAALQIHRWRPDRHIVMVGDSAFAAIEFLAAVRSHFCVVTRLRLDANLFGFPPQKRKGRGRPAIKGKPHKSCPPSSRIPKSPGSATASVSGTAEPTASSKSPPAPRCGIAVACRQCRSVGFSFAIRQASWSRTLSSPPTSMLAPETFSHGSFSRWQVEVTFAEVRAHLSVESQRQWSDKAILGTTPVLLGLFSIVTLWAHDLYQITKARPHGIQKRS